MSDADLLRVKGLGRKTLIEIRHALGETPTGNLPAQFDLTWEETQRVYAEARRRYSARPHSINSPTGVLRQLVADAIGRLPL